MGITTMAEARSSNRAALTYREVAAILGVDERTVSASARAGTLPVVALGRRRLIPRERLIALFAVDTPTEGPAS